MTNTSLASRLFFKNRLAIKCLPKLLASSFPQKLLFKIFNGLSDFEKEELFYHSNIFLFNNNIEMFEGEVSIFFNDQIIKIPHRSGSINQLGRVFSLMGHDYDVKKCYKFLIANFKINVFYDVGANLGQHSLLMLSQKIKCFSFEPNKQCHDELLEIPRYNSFEDLNLIPKAVGANNGLGYLEFPEKQTWLGTISKSGNEINKVPIISLDDFSEKNPLPDLIKIDTEGFEFQVLSGANKLITERKPFVIFESSDENKEIFNFLFEKDYFIIPLKNSNYKKINLEEFISSKGNFLACHSTMYKF